MCIFQLRQQGLCQNLNCCNSFCFTQCVQVVPVLYPFHGVLVVCKVVEAQRHSRGSHGRPWDFQQLLNSSVSDKLCSKLLVQQQRCQVLERVKGEWEKENKVMPKRCDF